MLSQVFSKVEWGFENTGSRTEYQCLKGESIYTGKIRDSDEKDNKSHSPAIHHYTINKILLKLLINITKNNFYNLG